MGFTAAAPPVRQLQPRAPTFRPLSLLVSFLLQLQFFLFATERLFPRHRADLPVIMAYGSTPYVGMTPKKNGGHIKSAQMTRSKCLHRSVNGLHEPYQALSSTCMDNRTVNLLERIAKVPDRQSLKRAKSSLVPRPRPAFRRY